MSLEELAKEMKESSDPSDDLIARFHEEVSIYAAESGADREFDYDPEMFAESFL